MLIRCEARWFIQEASGVTPARSPVEIQARGRRVEVGGPVSDTIVLAEDDADLRAIYAACLRRDGYQIWEAGNGAEALELVRAQVPKLLIIDFWMPILNGFEVIERLVDAPEAVGMKVVVLTHQNDSDTRLEGFALGIRDYWTKDISLDTLRRRVRELLEAFSIPTPSPTSPAS